MVANIINATQHNAIRTRGCTHMHTYTYTYTYTDTRLAILRHANQPCTRTTNALLNNRTKRLAVGYVLTTLI